MSDLPAKRRYNEEEVSRLLRRAAELQRSTPAAPNPSGLTLAELESIAAEAGLDSTHLRQAAMELDSGASLHAASSLGRRLAGAPLRIVLEHTVHGEVPAAVFANLVAIIQIAADAPGQASQVGRTLTWHSQNPSNPRALQILITVRDGETHIRIEERYGGLAAALFAGGLGGVGGGLGVGMGGAIGGFLGSTAIAIALPLTIATGAYVGARAIYSSIVRRPTNVLQQLMQRLTEELTRASREALPP